MKVKKQIQKVINGFWKREEGQSLMEIIIALAIGALLIGGASTAIVVVLQSSKTSQINQSATALVQGLMENVKIYSSGNWGNIYNLKKSSSTTYFLNSSTTGFFHIEGKEGVLDGEITSGLVGHWKLDSATGTMAYDFSNNNNLGTLHNDPVHATSSCQLGNCLDFDGSDDYLDTNFIIPNQGSISFWFNPDVDGDYVGQFSILDARDGGRWFTFGYGGNFGEGYLTFSCEDADDADYFAKFDITSYVTSGNWYYVVGTWEIGSPLKLYVDGVLRGSSNSLASFDIDDHGNDLFIGKNRTTYSWSPVGYYDGKIDDVRVYNRVLSADEINYLYDSIMFDRYFYVENVCRTNDFDYELAGVAPCDAGEILDSSTQRITTVVEWPSKSDNSNFSLQEYVTRWKNDIFNQSDWSGGVGGEDAVIDYTNQFSSSTDIDFSDLGEIKIDGF
jgi:hypothetical protein